VRERERRRDREDAIARETHRVLAREKVPYTKRKSHMNSRTFHADGNILAPKKDTSTYMQTNTHTNRQTDRQTDRQIDGQTDRQIDLDR